MKQYILRLSVCLPLALLLLPACAAVPTVTVSPTDIATVTVTDMVTLPGTLAGSSPRTAVPLDDPSAVSILPFAVTEVPLDTNGPVKPHAGSVGGQYGTCYSCHSILPDHTGENANLDNCMHCHPQGPIVLEP